MLEKLTPQQRMLIATVLSLVFFVAYSYLVPQPQPQNVDKNSQTTEQQANTSTSNPDVQAPTVSTTTVQNTNSATPKVAINPTLNALVTIESNDFIITIDNLGRISSKTLLADKYMNDNGIKAQLIQPHNPKPLEIRFENAKINQEAFSVNYTTSANTVDLKNSSTAQVVLTQNLTDLTVTKTITFYQDGHYDLKVDLSQYQRYFLSNGIRPNPNPNDMSFTVTGSMVKTNNGITTIVEDEDAEFSQVFRDVQFMSSFDRYYASVFYNIPQTSNIILEGDIQQNPIMFIEGSQNLGINGYLGVKDYNILESLDPKLTSVIEYGFFTFISEPLFTVLKFFHDEVTHNWGWAIVLLTIAIRLVLYPLTYKGMMGMSKLKEIAPQMKEIQQRYKGNPQQASAKMMELYKKHGANPMGGCLPLLLQIPFFFAIYRVLLNAVELQGAEWIIWIDDLAKMDPYFVLPILMGATMFYQQHITPTNFTDPMQEKMFKFLPLIFTFFFITFPAGLTLYWFVNNLFSIGQQFYINKIIEKRKAEKEVLAKEKVKK